MFKKSIALPLLILSSFANAEVNINTSFGVFEMTEGESIGIQKIQTYKLSNKVVGKSEWVGVDGKLLGIFDGKNYLVLRGGTGGNGCAEVLSIVKISKDDVNFSPSLNACGGVENVEFNNGVITVIALERDEKTRVKYTINGEKILENGKNMLTKFDFLSNQ